MPVKTMVEKPAAMSSAVKLRLKPQKNDVLSRFIKPPLNRDFMIVKSIDDGVLRAVYDRVAIHGDGG